MSFALEQLSTWDKALIFKSIFIWTAFVSVSIYLNKSQNAIKKFNFLNLSASNKKKNPENKPTNKPKQIAFARECHLPSSPPIAECLLFFAFRQ